MRKFGIHFYFLAKVLGFNTVKLARFAVDCLLCIQLHYVHIKIYIPKARRIIE
jgi:hypothetical protein